MGLFKNKIMAKKDAKVNFDEVYKEIFSIIADHHESIVEEVAYCIENPRIFAKKNDELFDARGVNSQTAAEFKIKWLGCVEIMLRHGCAVEFDHNVDFDTFYERFGELDVVKSRGVLPSDDDIYLDYGINNWFAAIDRCWMKSGLCVGAVDIDSDSYVVFVCTAEQLDQLGRLAEKVARRIVRAREL